MTLDRNDALLVGASPPAHSWLNHRMLDIELERQTSEIRLVIPGESNIEHLLELEKQMLNA